MSGVGFIGREIVEHGVDCDDERRQSRETGKDRAIADLAFDREGNGSAILG
jgi:hypothetical protein